MNLCVPERLPGVNVLLEELRHSVQNKWEAVNMLTSSTSDKRSSDLRVEAPTLGHTSPPPKPTLKVNTASWVGLLSQADGSVHSNPP